MGWSVMPTPLIVTWVLLQLGLIAMPTMNWHPAWGGSDTNLQASVHDYTLSSDTFLQALLQVSERFHVPMGIEWVRNEQSLRKVSLHWGHANVLQVIKTLAGTQKGYDFETRNSVVHVFPAGSPSDTSDFLNVRIAKAEVKNGTILVGDETLTDWLRPIIRPRSPPDPHTAVDIAFGGPTSPEPSIDLAFQDVSVRDILDRLALATDRKIWVVTYPASRGFTPTGFRRVESLFAHDFIPTDYQGFWITFRWGERVNACSLRPECVEVPNGKTAPK
jgi:hypothetical protein